MWRGGGSGDDDCPGGRATGPVACPWRDPALPTAQRVDALIAQMTIEEKASQLVNQARAISRLGVPAYNWWSEALHGVANNGFATVFPEPIGLAATFDAPTIKTMGEAIGTEGRVKWNLIEKRRRRAPHHAGPHLLVAQHQHLPRSALGAAARKRTAKIRI